MKRVYPVFLIFFIVLAGCNSSQSTKFQFELITNSSQVIRLDKVTGNMLIVSPSGVKAIQGDSEVTPKQVTAFAAKREILSLPETKDAIQVGVVYKLRGDSLVYKAIISSYSQKLIDATNSIGTDLKQSVTDRIIFTFLDSDGFKVVEKGIELSSGMRYVDENGEVAALSFEGAIPCSVEEFGTISNLSLPWIYSDVFRKELAAHVKSLSTKSGLNSSVAGVESLDEPKKSD